ncbi:ABC transporter ATP-binding protein/permease [Aureimonas fodinaquatilis]|uniref:ABC transporter ATP-binding protein/permease n=1 Tax=Aureimonas fodinaquatilis TaxID=2565783 RepID=A0A5B0DMN6_9HYPH|nr:SbmA/BacA-like family transporter [Aureimonas fodinaquatilis]KAA0968137.1 ABC transporter ATP-binding protein/permease [Aureimonas fodinaquatilis]
MARLARQFMRLIRICISTPAGRIGLVIFGVVLCLKLGSIYASLRLIQWTGEFYSAVQAVNGPEILHQIGIFAVIVGLNSVRHLISEYMRKHLEFRWRRVLTDHALDVWTRNKAYWHLANSPDYAIDNPDQRIAEDCRLFVSGLLGELLDLIQSIVGLFSYVALLWALSNFALSLAPVGLAIEIPHYMVWAAFLYAAISSIATHLLGRRLKPVLAEQQHREANFRFALARWRGHFDSIALSDGEAAERRQFDARFEDVAVNWRRLVNRETILQSFTYPFQHSVLRIPLFVAMPGYLAGSLDFGGLMQIGMAFSNVVTTLSWFIFSYRDLAELAATGARLDNFLQAATAFHTKPGTVQTSHAEDRVELTDLQLRSPTDVPLLSLPALTLRHGEDTWIRGESGIGKTTLLKAISGFWPYVDGQLARPADSIMFLPQRPYVPSGSLMEAAVYPGRPEDFGPGAVIRALGIVGLEHGVGNRPLQVETLSGGETQRLALARLLLHRPRFAILDEATSALDATGEHKLLCRLRQELPDTTFIMIAHRQPPGFSELRSIDLMQFQQKRDMLWQPGPQPTKLPEKHLTALTSESVS